jgi:predicted transcriptional regulator
MAKNTPQALSEAQQEIMEIIWDRGEVSASEVWDILRERRDVARNTVQTTIVRIEQKGWIEHRSIGRTFVYKAIQPRTTTLRQRLDDLMSAAGRGSAEALVTALLEDASLTKDAADRIRAMIDEAEQRTKKKKGNR